jgi:hypothetical protein
VADAERLRHRRQETVGQRRCVGGRAELRLHDGELVAAQPGDRVPAADGGGEPVADRPEELVAAAVPERVVDLL